MSTPTNSADASCGELSCDECDARTAALTAERDRLRAELEKVYVLVTPVGFDLPGGIFETAQAVTELRAEVERLNALNTWAHTCIHHNDKQRTECPVCLVTTLTAERDQLLAVLVHADQILDDIDTCSDAHKPMYSAYSQNVFKLCIKGRDARRDVIDAALKKGAK